MVDRLTADFKSVVEKYSRSQQSIATKMKQILLINASQNDDLMGDERTGGTGDDQQGLQKQLLARQQQQFEEEMMLEREQRVQQIEADVLDVNSIMRELSTMINDQGESISKWYSSAKESTLMVSMFF
jgi:t-SNARE domain-containing protein 1